MRVIATLLLRLEGALTAPFLKRRTKCGLLCGNTLSPLALSPEAKGESHGQDAPQSTRLPQ